MTHKEMSEIFAVMLLAYPNAEVFKGGIAKLGPTISLWVTCLPDVDFWTSQQAVYKLVRECKYPPTIAEFKEKADKVKDDMQSLISTHWDVVRLHLSVDGVKETEEWMKGNQHFCQVLNLMGGSLIVPKEYKYADGRIAQREEYNYDGFVRAEETVMRKENALAGNPKHPAIGAGRKQLEGKNQ